MQASEYKYFKMDHMFYIIITRYIQNIKIQLGILHNAPSQAILAIWNTEDMTLPTKMLI